MRLSPCKTALSLSVLERRLIFPTGPFSYGQKGFWGGDLAARSHDCARGTGKPEITHPNCRGRDDHH